MWTQRKENVQFFISLETEATKDFLVNLQFVCFYEKTAIKRMRYVHKIWRQGAYTVKIF